MTYRLTLPALALLALAPLAHAKDQHMPDLLPVTIESIAHDQQRYPTVGDYWLEDGKLVIKVSAMSDPRYSFLVALHELVEASLVRARGIPIEAVDDFDVAYEAKRKAGDESEPGDSPAAPYHREHVFATKIEKLMAKELGVDWKAYDAAVEELP